MAMENGPGLKMYFLLHMGIFYCHVSFLECNFYCHLVSIAWNLKKAPILEKAKYRHKPPIFGFHVFRGCIKPPCFRICLFYFILIFHMPHNISILGFSLFSFSISILCSSMLSFNMQYILRHIFRHIFT